VCPPQPKILNSPKIELGPLRRRPVPLGLQEALVAPLESGMRREVKRVRGLTSPLSVNLPRALVGTLTTVQVCSLRYHTSLGVPWPKIRRESRGLGLVVLDQDLVSTWRRAPL
jgi:hypothetical protein